MAKLSGKSKTSANVQLEEDVDDEFSPYLDPEDRESTPPTAEAEPEGDGEV